MNRYRPSTGRVLTELLYGKHVEYNNNTFNLNITEFSRAVSMRPLRLIEALTHLRGLGLITQIDYTSNTSGTFKEAAVKLKQPNCSPSPTTEHSLSAEAPRN